VPASKCIGLGFDGIEPGPGRKCLGKELRELIFRMVAENTIWRAPRIHCELRFLGLDISERTISRRSRKVPRSLVS
jgi:hypothetical protein